MGSKIRLEDEPPFTLRPIMYQPTLSLILAFLVMATGQAIGQELTDVKCVISGKPATADAMAEYRGGKVYMCCDKCVAAFREKAKDFAVKANHQLLLTGQFVQKACPVSGQPVAKDIKLTVGAVEVAFADADSLKKVEGLGTVEEKVALIFADQAFEKAFALKPTWNITDVKCFLMPKRDVKEAKSVDHHGGQA